MTEFNINANRACVSEYVNLSLSAGKGQKVLRVALYACVFLIAAVGIVSAIVIRQPVMLLVAFAGILAGIAYPLLIHFILKGTIDKAAADLERETGVIAAVSDMNILLLKDGLPRGILEWADISKIIEGKTGFFLKAGQDSLLLLAKESVVSGTYEEAAQILRAKAAQK